MTTVELVDLLRHAYDGDPWHGPSLTSVLARCTAERAAAAVMPGRHSIWEIVLHVTGWTGEVAQRLGGSLAGEPPEGDWPAVASTSPEAWRQTLARLDAVHRSLLDAVAAQPDTKWIERVGDTRDPAAGTGVSHGVMIVGLATHYAYHAGQIALLS
jgi:uncharacterized damage-inducible protein DinB